MCDDQAAAASQPADQPRAPQDDRTWLTPGVLSVGAASLASDAGHEITTSLLPSFLTSTLGAGPAALGAIEGVSDALLGISKLEGVRWRTTLTGAPEPPPVATS